ncbi:hypothetical protein SapgrDRAFT_1511 [Saprospira grandis DSM 2844]|uniref:Uncharacterized protein n=1 Tax=Saprospira grandis DSM 2844 TaxID=694433 RepID=J0P0C5_9BACT|nr:hypothetical protein [Saprospira grandis]EJF53224.1 hypothetical protein SapgrDRAFT_1511 [Saprospira grandis DSM 2844]
MSKSKYKAVCLAALKDFVEEKTNEAKMELYMAYEELEEPAERNVQLGEELHAVLRQIIEDNKHPDDYLDSLKSLFF